MTILTNRRSTGGSSLGFCARIVYALDQKARKQIILKTQARKHQENHN